MRNAHERFGTLEFTKHTKDTTNSVRVHVDRAVLEPAKQEKGQARAHLISMIGGDSEIGALWAAVTVSRCLPIWPAGGARVGAMVYARTQSAESNSPLGGTGMHTRGG